MICHKVCFFSLHFLVWIVIRDETGVNFVGNWYIGDNDEEEKAEY